ncbi:CoA pyrophosphatase [Rouxiella sp. WC2420]|uniref:CoA pyrophosphatase n=1 Tax=Rouxiella sp. WC2420 TaxID=3234145 RepID=A0AB39VN39_9GAMM
MSLVQLAPLPAEVEDFVRRFQLHLPTTPVRKAIGQRQAAVLIPIVCREQPTILLTRRSDRLRKHAGQVAFPGGATDASDPSAVFTALREAHEEVAIPPAMVRVLGQLNPVDSSSGFRVTPVVGLIPVDTPLHPNEDEVAELFEIPLQEALNFSRYHPLEIHRKGISRRVYFSWYEEQFVWGMTAGIILQLAQQIAN